MLEAMSLLCFIFEWVQFFSDSVGFGGLDFFRRSALWWATTTRKDCWGSGQLLEGILGEKEI